MKAVFLYVVFLGVTLAFVLALLAGCSKHVERFDSEPRKWTKTYEPGGKP
jgi:hypothetical protein